MKQTKRILSLLLSLCLVLGLIPSTAFAAGGNLPFTDVNTTDWCYDAVQYVYEKGMMTGTSTTTFSPDGTTTRGMIVTILHRMEGTPAAAGTVFTDVPTGQWYSDAVSWASANGIVGGYGNGRFGPGDPITREQMAAILNRYSTHKGYTADAAGSITGFADAAQVSSYAVEPMGWAIGNGLISGTGNNMLAPKGNATRAQVATILMRFCQNIADKNNGTPAPDTTVEKTYTVTFDLNYGSDTRYDVKTVKEGETVGKPSNPSRGGYSFSGWYAEKSGGRQFDFKTGITSDLTLYAHWSSNSSSSSGGGGGSYVPPSHYTVTFYMNDGTGAVHTTSSVVYGGTVSEPAQPTRSGYSFGGWYIDAATTSAYNFSSTVTGNLSLYAKWTGTALPDDEDGDGVVRAIEDIWGTDPEKDDTDDDGLSDAVEINVLGTDPTMADTDGNGINDGLEDYDADGLTNNEEVERGTNLLIADSDHDGLSDYDEVYIYHTNPLNDDTDGDGILDGDEVGLGTDPLSPSSLGTIEQTLDSEQIDDTLLTGNAAVPSVRGASEDVLNRIVSLHQSSEPSLEDNRAVVGKGVSLDLDGAADLALSFDIASSIDCPVIMKLSETEGWVLADSTRGPGGSLSTNVSESGTYCVMDLDVLLPLLGVDPDDYYDRIMGTFKSRTSPLWDSDMQDQLLWDSDTNTLDEPLTDSNSDTPDEPLEDSDINTSDQQWSDEEQDEEQKTVSDNSGSGSVTLDTSIVDLIDNYFDSPVALADASMGQADIAFVIDTTGSMSDEISNVANNIIMFAHTLTTVYNVNANFALVDYRDITVDGLDSTKVIMNGSSNWYTTVSSFRDAVSAMRVDGGGDTPETAVDALECSRNLDFRGSANKFVILVTDAGYKINNNYGISSMTEEINLLSRDGIIVSVVAPTSYQSTYQDLYGKTGGIFANIYGNFSEELLSLADLIGESVNKGNWILLNDFQHIALDAPLAPGSGDTDHDGVSDWDELERAEQLDLTNLVRERLRARGIPQDMIDEYFTSEDGVYITVYPYKSNPVLKDTDFDGLDDGRDARPRNNSFKGTVSSGKAEKGVGTSFNLDYRRLAGSTTTIYQKDVSVFASILAHLAYGGSIEMTSGTSFSGNIKDLYGEFGLSNVMSISLNSESDMQYLSSVTGMTFTAYHDDDLSEIILGHRLIETGSSTRDLIVATIRGTNATVEEWSSDFDVGANNSSYWDNDNPDWTNKSQHKGFDVASNRLYRIILAYADTFLDAKADKSIFLTGHSRGAAIANILGAKFEDDSSYSTTSTYSFATPNVAIISKATADSYKTVFSVVNKDDIVPYLPLESWGYRKYGRVREYSVQDFCEKEWEKMTGIWDYNCNGHKKTTIEKFSKLAKTRDDLYVFPKDNYTWIESTSRNEQQLIYQKIREYYGERMGRYANVSTWETGNIFVQYSVRADQYPAFLMMALAELASGQVNADSLKDKGCKWGYDTVPVFGNYLGASVAKAYSSAKTHFIWSALDTAADWTRLGGMQDGHMSETYIVLAHNIDKNVVLG